MLARFELMLIEMAFLRVWLRGSRRAFGLHVLLMFDGLLLMVVCSSLFQYGLVTGGPAVMSIGWIVVSVFSEAAPFPPGL